MPVDTSVLARIQAPTLVPALSMLLSGVPSHDLSTPSMGQPSTRPCCNDLHGKEYGTADCLGWARSRGSDFACARWQLRLNAPCSAPQKTLGRNLHAGWTAFDLFVAVQHQRQRSRGPSSFVFGSKTNLLLFHVRQSPQAGFLNFSRTNT